MTSRHSEPVSASNPNRTHCDTNILIFGYLQAHPEHSVNNIWIFANMQAPLPEHSVSNIWIFGFASPPPRTQCNQYLGIFIYLLAMFRLFLSMFFLHFFHLCSGYVPLATSRRSSADLLSMFCHVLSVFYLRSGSVPVHSTIVHQDLLSKFTLA